MATDTQTIELTLRAAMLAKRVLAKRVLALVNMDPDLGRLQMREIVHELAELQRWFNAQERKSST